MGLNLRIHGITCPDDFTLSYLTGRTPSNSSNFVTYGTYSGGTTEITVSGIPEVFGEQYWFKITNNITQNWIISNIYVHEQSYYQDCLDCPITPTPTPTNIPTPTVTPTNTPTPTVTPTVTPTLTPTSTTLVSPTVTPTTTVTPTNTPTSPIIPTPTVTPTPTPFCQFDVEVTASDLTLTPTITPTITPTVTPTNTPTPTVTPTPTPFCLFDVEVTLG